MKSFFSRVKQDKDKDKDKKKMGGNFAAIEPWALQQAPYLQHTDIQTSCNHHLHHTTIKPTWHWISPISKNSFGRSSWNRHLGHHPLNSRPPRSSI